MNSERFKLSDCGNGNRKSFISKRKDHPGLIPHGP